MHEGKGVYVFENNSTFKENGGVYAQHAKYGIWEAC